MHTHICCIFNIAAHYRAPIYTLMDEQLHCDFYLGDKVASPIKKMDYQQLKGFKKILKRIQLPKGLYYQKGAIPLIFKRYTHYILTGEPHCLSTWLILLAAQLTGKKTFLWTHGWYGDEGRFKKMIKKIFFSLCDKVLLYGDYARNLMIKEGINPEKLVCIYNSLDYKKQLEIRNTLTTSSIYSDYFNNTDPVILYVGRVQKVKKLDLLFNAIAQLNRQNTPCNMIVIGQEIDNFSVNTATDEYGLKGKVWYYGPCYDENILGQLIYNAAVCVSPGNIGLTAMHSLTYGTPTITHNNYKNQMPEFEAIEPGATGSFFIENSVDSLMEHINKWISISPAEREQIRKKCFEKIDTKYNPYKQIEILKKILTPQRAF